MKDLAELNLIYSTSGTPTSPPCDFRVAGVRGHFVAWGVADGAVSIHFIQVYTLSGIFD